ncbi:precorrin-3B synthase [Gordonia rhizosphera]|uniref:Putative precorrin-3B synthase n=1 Tax=Gordonia rhizosphera NBRC 16068 TaxID=1108045 RepID=K6WWL7_9ACTN|nr:precorrin-3B synthase [Gordonia rhizosphera]GAB90959.1 putative precorrin-3B synthase [Gordonia rhizosphera NBRC 16068]
MSQSHRTTADRCPGVFSTHLAADGAVARVRLPGGRIRADQLQLLAQAAAAYADGFLEMTVRANLQLRGIADTDAVAAAVIDAGLAPSSTHDKARNIEVSPLTGRIGGLADVRPIADRLDELLRADPAGAALSGRFLFGIDDGRGDIVARHPDAGALIVSVDPKGAPLAGIRVGDVPVGTAEGVDAIARALLSTAEGIVEIAPDAWRVGDLSAEERAALEARVGERLGPADDSSPTDRSPTGRSAAEPAGAGEPIVGWFEQDDGRVLLGGVVEHGRIPARLAEFLAAIEAPIIITPDREILLCDLTEQVAETVVRVLAPMGLIFDAASPWARVSCCVGAPGCAKGLAPVRDDLAERVRVGEPVTDREHWVGCGRACGSPAGPHLRVEALPDGGYTSHRR